VQRKSGLGFPEEPESIRSCQGGYSGLLRSEKISTKKGPSKGKGEKITQDILQGTKAPV